MAPVYSHSRLSCFENCPKQFHYRYVEKLRIETESVEAFMGKLVHEVIERLNHVVPTGRVPTLDAVVRRFEIWWNERFDAKRIRIVRSENPPDYYRDLGARCLENFYRREYPFDLGESLGVEEPVTFHLDEHGKYRMRGVIDHLVQRHDGTIQIQDYKTGRRLPSQSDLDEDRQLALYQIAIADRYGEKFQIELVWHFLQRNQRRTSTRTPEQIRELRARTMELIDTIQAETRFEARPSALCKWCEFNDRCPAVSPGDRTAPPPAPPAPSNWVRDADDGQLALFESPGS